MKWIDWQVNGGGAGSVSQAGPGAPAGATTAAAAAATVAAAGRATQLARCACVRVRVLVCARRACEICPFQHSPLLVLADGPASEASFVGGGRCTNMPSERHFFILPLLLFRSSAPPAPPPNPARCARVRAHNTQTRTCAP